MTAAACLLCGRPVYRSTFLLAVLLSSEEMQRWREHYAQLSPSDLCSECLLKARKLTRHMIH